MSNNKVIITDLRTQEARDILAFLNENGYEAVAVPEDVRLWDEAALSAFAETQREGLTAVIHPAPPLFQKSLEEITEEDFAAARDDGPLSAWCVTKIFGGIFRENRAGTIIYLNSFHAEKPVGYGFLFSGGCGAVQMLAREVNQDYGTSGVRSFFIQRGVTSSDPDARSDLSAIYYGVDMRYPDRQLPQRGYLNGLIAFLLTPAAAPLAGSDLRADGGMSMYYGERISEEKAREVREQYLRELYPEEAAKHEKS